jgi:hypothetical protein
LRVIENSGQPDTFLDQLGNPVALQDVQVITDESVYEKLIAPGTTNQDGQFSRWLSDVEYRQLLGQEEIKYGIWRTQFRFQGVPPDAYNKRTGNVAVKIDNLVKELEDAGFPKGQAITRELAETIINNPYANQAPWLQNFSGTTADGKPVSGTLSFDGTYLRVAMKEPYRYANEVTQLDAFLYANARIAGKLGPRGGFINGGLIARELGVLAPGRNGYSDWLDKLTVAEANKFNYCDRSARPTDSVDEADNDPAKSSCSYVVRYDHRLRNGGYGFNLYQGTTGISADWKFDSDGCSNVFSSKPCSP